MAIKLIYAMIVLGGLMSLAYYLKKHLKDKGAAGTKKSDLISIVDEGLTVGVGAKVSVIKTGDEYFIMGQTQGSMTFQKLEGNPEKFKASWDSALIRAQEKTENSDEK